MFTFFRNIFREKTDREQIDKLEKEFKLKSNQINQDLHDDKLLRKTKSEAYNMFVEWRDYQNSPGAIFWKEKINLEYIEPISIYCFGDLIYEWYPSKCRYTSEDLDNIRSDEYKRLKEEYKTKQGINGNVY